MRGIVRCLREGRPSHDLAVLAGMLDLSYSTPRWGVVAYYMGDVKISFPNGDVWRAIGHPPQGTIDALWQEGYIEFKQILQ
mgnify:CR=1 FL=1